MCHGTHHVSISSNSSGTASQRLALGCRLDPQNVFRWHKVVLNLPGDETYDPSLAWVRRVREDGTLAADVHPYVDDLRKTAPTEQEAWIAASCMAKTAAYFGLQDAARKRRPPSRTPGAWAGAIVSAEPTGVYKMVSPERWGKVKAPINNLQKWASQQHINRKSLEKVQGFLVYVSLTFSAMVPYLKGLHLTLENWRPDRDADGWHMTPTEFAAYLQENKPKWVDLDEEPPSISPPAKVSPVPCFKEDVLSLAALTSAPDPPKVLVRPRAKAVAALLFGDASGAGLGTSLWLQGTSTIQAKHGVWTCAYGSRSSKFRELYNLVARTEALIQSNE
ncbi:hypothetical protein ACA910_015870 [Epithemia clementina (nom. ined.)]